MINASLEQFNFQIDTDLKRRFRAACKAIDKPMGVVLIEFIEDFVKSGGRPPLASSSGRIDSAEDVAVSAFRRILNGSNPYLKAIAHDLMAMNDAYTWVAVEKQTIAIAG